MADYSSISSPVHQLRRPPDLELRALRSLPGVVEWASRIEERILGPRQSSSQSGATTCPPQEEDAFDLTNLGKDRDPPTPPQTPRDATPDQTPNTDHNPSPVPSSPTAGQAQHRQSIQFPTWPTQADDVTASEVSLLPVVSQFEGQPPGAQPEPDGAADAIEEGEDEQAEEGRMEGEMRVDPDEGAEDPTEFPSLGRDTSSPPQAREGAPDEEPPSSSSAATSSVHSSSSPPPAPISVSRARKRPGLDEIIVARGFDLPSWRESVKQAGTGLERIVDHFERRVAAKAGGG